MRRLLFILLILISLFALATPAFASDAMSVYYVSDPDSSVLKVLELAGFERVDTPECRNNHPHSI